MDASFLNLYAKLQREVDRHIGQVLRTLNSRPEVAANTVIVFTSDHGEYGGSHGLRGKGAGAYEEAIRVPLIVKDNRGQLTAAPETTRRPADLERRHRAAAADDRHRLERLAQRSALRPHRRPRRPRGDPRRPQRAGASVCAARHRRDRHRVRDRVLRRQRAAARRRRAHAGGEVRRLLELAARRDRTADRGEERELYDYAHRRAAGWSCTTAAEQSKLEDGLRVTLAQAFPQELRAPLPRRLNGRSRRAASPTTSASPRTRPTTRPPRANAARNGTSKASGNREACSAGESRVKRAQIRFTGEAPMTAPEASSACACT